MRLCVYSYVDKCNLMRTNVICKQFANCTIGINTLNYKIFRCSQFLLQYHVVLIIKGILLKGKVSGIRIMTFSHIRLKLTGINRTEKTFFEIMFFYFIFQEK